MIGSSSASVVVDDRYTSVRPPFLASHRALAACTRELERLSKEIEHGVAALPSANGGHKPVVRQAPGRCIVQLGPVALTLAWLRKSLDSISTGELLVIVWRGAVAPRQQHQPERPVVGRTPLPATALWEQVLTPVADSEANWAWQPRDTGAGQCSSTELAARCVERLCVAYQESDPEWSPLANPTPASAT